METRKFNIRNCKISKMMENQRTLQKYTNTRFMKFETLTEKYNTAIFVEAAEAIAETNYKWWKTPETNIAALKVELSDIFCFALDFSLLLNKEAEIETLLKKDWILVDSYERDFSTMITRLKLISSQKFMDLFDSNYGIQVMRAIIDIAVLYGYIDIDEVILNKQLINIKRQQNGYNTQLECATE